VQSRLTTAAGRDALLVRRFDRGPADARTMAVSGLTMLGLDEMMGRYATYPDLLDVLRTHGFDPEEVGRELFLRIAANIALGNSDDHARNHAALWDGQHLTLSPAYDLDPCRSPGWDSNQAMAYGREAHDRRSNLSDLIRCSAVYGLNRSEGLEIVDHTIASITKHWQSALDTARLTRTEGQQLLGSRILNPAVLDRVQ
jgi:serine/threonine-protein kinase HipA